jgi:ABC-type amino acid transport substrate-binding protein
MIAAAMMVRPSRAEELAHSVTYIRVNEVIIVKSTSTITISSLDDLFVPGITPGCQAGTTQYDAFLDLGTEDVDFKAYPKADTLMLNLENGVIDAAFVDEPVYSVWSKVYGLKIIYTVPAEPMALWARWDEPELMEIINTVILEAYRDGIMDDLYEKWFG